MSGSKKEVNYSKQKMKSRIAWIIATIFAVFWLLVALVPFIFMILNSLRKQFVCFRRCFPPAGSVVFEKLSEYCCQWNFRIFLTKRDYSDSIPDSDADNLCICGISAVQNEVPVPRGYLCRNRGNDVHPDACYADPDLQDDYEHRNV